MKKVSIFDMPRTQLVSHTIWRVIDSHWTCISEAMPFTFIEYLGKYGFGDLPDTINYCLAESRDYTLKFRHTGGKIEVFICKKLY